MTDLERYWYELLLSLRDGRPRRLVFDVDGVVCDDSDSSIPYDDRVPYPHAVTAINELKKMGHTIIFCTARYMQKFDGNQVRANEYGGQELRWWLKRWGISYDEVYLGKPSGHMYIDDRACRVNSNRGIIDWADNFGPLMKELTK